MINPNEKYFIASFRYNKEKPEDFGLKAVSGKDYFIDKKGNRWKNKILWDSGWGNEYGFVKLPEPNFEQLWNLLVESNIKENRLGAAELLTDYPIELKKKLQAIFKKGEKINKDMSQRLKYLEVLNTVTNHSDMKGKKPEEVNADYEEWKNLKTDFDRLKTENIWNRITKKL